MSFGFGVGQRHAAIAKQRKKEAKRVGLKGAPDWFIAMSPKARKAYLKAHPNSKVAKIGKVGKKTNLKFGAYKVGMKA